MNKFCALLDNKPHNLMGADNEPPSEASPHVLVLTESPFRDGDAKRSATAGPYAWLLW